METLLNVYGLTDKTRFPSYGHPEVNADRPDSTFYADFRVCELCYPRQEDKIVAAIRDTYKRACAAWQNNVKMHTEMTVALNHLLWLHYEAEGPTSRIGKVYSELWQNAHAHAGETFTGDDYTHYWKVTD